MAKSRRGNTPRRKRMDRAARMRVGKAWLSTYPGRDPVKGYQKWFGVDPICAIVELRMLGLRVDERRYHAAVKLQEEKARRRAAKARCTVPDPIRRQQEEDEWFLAEEYRTEGSDCGRPWEEWEKVPLATRIPKIWYYEDDLQELERFEEGEVEEDVPF